MVWQSILHAPRVTDLDGREILRAATSSVSCGAQASTFSLYDRQRKALPSPDSDSAIAVATIRSWSGDLWQAGSALRASPVSASAWQRHPPQSISRRSHERQGSRIHSVPRNALKAGFDCQMSESE